ncbi:hypothetical protein [Paraflavitalea speifideaquila]|nr:hypothetical protein [Paraflavitalea speifideiaquila]
MEFYDQNKGLNQMLPLLESILSKVNKKKQDPWRPFLLLPDRNRQLFVK